MPTMLVAGRRAGPGATAATMGPWRALSLQVSVAVDAGDADLRGAVDAALGALPPGEVADHHYRLARRPDATVDVHRGVDLVATGVACAEAVEWLVWDCTRLAAASTRHLLLHAGAVAGGEGAVLVPGPSGSGKSTLVAALVMGGHGYLSDELAALGTGGRVLPFPRGLGLDTRARRMLGALDGVEAAHVPPDALHPAWQAGPCPVAAVVVPRRVDGPGGTLRPLPVDRAVLALATAAVNLPVHGTGGLRLLAALAGRCLCYELTVGDMGAARAAVASVVAP